jgi:hypothetical protein
MSDAQNRFYGGGGGVGMQGLIENTGMSEKVSTFVEKIDAQSQRLRQLPRESLGLLLEAVSLYRRHSHLRKNRRKPWIGFLLFS